jgi:hypothetical protein
MAVIFYLGYFVDRGGEHKDYKDKPYVNNLLLKDCCIREIWHIFSQYKLYAISVYI